VVIAALAACYSPSYRDCEVLCASGTCPAGFSCEQGVCRTAGFSGACGQMNDDMGMPADAEIDGNAMLDTDMDGKNDAIDNCRTISNPDQANEDGDVFGDVCDPCPPLATYLENNVVMDANLDSDNDLVGDGCDPNKLQFGDRLVFFSGFNGAVPGTFAGPVMPMISNGDARIAAPNSQDWGAVSFPIAIDTSKSQYVTTAIHVNNVIASPLVAEGGGALVFFDGASRGAACMRGIDTANNPTISLVEVNNNNPITVDETQATPMDAMVRVKRRSGTQFDCNLMPPMTIAVGPVNVPISPQSRVGVYARSADVVFHWVMFVEGN